MTRLARSANYVPAQIPTPALIADIELTDLSAPLRLVTTHAAARLLVRLHGRPIGYADLIGDLAAPIDRGRILAALDSAATARALRHLAADQCADGAQALPVELGLATALDLRAGAPCATADAPTTGPLITVAICTRDRAASIGHTLDSLLRQTYRAHDILVVDNAPRDDATERLVRTSYPAVRYVRELRPGLDWARNRAIAEARGSLIAYIDDDAIADPRWLQALVASFAAPDVACVTGLVVPLRLDTPAQELFERFGFSKGFDQLTFRLATPLANAGFPYKGYLGTGCNSAFRCSVFEQVGQFDVCLDVGTPVPGGGDLDMFARIIRAGYGLTYDPGAIVFHDHIDDMAILIDKMGQYQQAAIAYFTKHILTDRERAFGLAVHIGWSMIRRPARGLAAVLIKRDRPLALVLNQAMYAWLGPLALYRSYRRAGDVRAR
jgi:glycosyltransferase involved in cell wall biosynthesis